jgi:hypothetical protein
MELQKAIRARLVGAAGVVALVPGNSILDRNARPAPNPSIILGEDQTIEGEDIARRQERIISTVHVWKKEPSLEGVKAIAGAIRSALQASRLVMGGGFQCVDCRVTGTRFLRDPDGETSHGVVTVESLVGEE